MILNFSRDKLSQKWPKFANFAKVHLAKVSTIKVFDRAQAKFEDFITLPKLANQPNRQFLTLFRFSIEMPMAENIRKKILRSEKGVCRIQYFTREWIKLGFTANDQVESRQSYIIAFWSWPLLMLIKKSFILRNSYSSIAKFRNPPE